VFGEPDEDACGRPSRSDALDSPDVVAAWRAHRLELKARAEALDALDLDAVHLVARVPT